jgi:hypothetical protein
MPSISEDDLGISGEASASLRLAKRLKAQSPEEAAFGANSRSPKHRRTDIFTMTHSKN